MKPIQKFVETAGWVQIAASPAIIGIVLGVVAYLFLDGLMGLIIGIITVVAGIIIGIVWATRIHKKRGTIEFLSRTMATPELDDPKEIN